MDGPRDYHTKQSQKRKRMPYEVTFMWNLKYDTNEFIYKSGPGSQTEICGFQGEQDMGKDWIGSLGLADANYYI